MSACQRVLVTGATGFIGAHIVDQLLAKGIKVRGTTRSFDKGKRMKEARPQYATDLEFVRIKDFTEGTSFEEAVKDVDGIIHAASPLTYDTKNNEEELIIPAINGVKAILSAAAKEANVARLVLTSSFASVVDIAKSVGPGFTYTGDDWNPLTYKEAAAPETSAVVAYRGAKKFAELEAWNFIDSQKPNFDLVTLCPPMTFGPVVHPVAAAEDLNESNSNLWNVAIGKPLPEARVPVWVDVRDLARAHVEALLRPQASMKRYTPASPEKWSYELAASILRRRYPQGKDQVVPVDGEIVPQGYDLDWKAVRDELGVDFHSFEDCIVDLFQGLEKQQLVPWKS